MKESNDSNAMTIGSFVIVVATVLAIGAVVMLMTGMIGDGMTEATQNFIDKIPTM